MIRLLSLLVLAGGAAMNGPALMADAPVATMRGGQITYGQIQCDAAVSLQPDQCLAQEQWDLERRILVSSIDAAAELHGIELSDEEKAAVQRRVDSEHAATVYAAERFRIAIGAALRLHRGEDPATVYEAAARQDVTTREVDGMAMQFATVAAAERALSRDFVREGDDSVRRFFHREAVMKRLTALAEKRRELKGTSKESAERQFWTEVFAHMNLKILNPNYQLPDFKNLFAEYGVN